MEFRSDHLQKPLSAEWTTAHRELLQKVKQRPFVSEYKYSAHANVNGGKVYLPAYVPYIGPNYFEYRPRVLCYAINQNLSPHVPWTEEWLGCWTRDTDYAQDRLNRAAQEGKAIPIRPYAEGFIPLVALMAVGRWIKSPDCLPEAIDDVIAVTNFVKFSTAKDASSSSIPKTWWRECGLWYVQDEIRVLRPDIILAFGQKTFCELKRVVNTQRSFDHKPKVLVCRFPARLASVKSRPLSSEESKVWRGEIVPLVGRMRRPEHSYHTWKMERFAGYFIDVVGSWRDDK
jgi:hypothetical protein